MTNFKTVMNELSNAFERRSRDNGDRFYTLKDGSPEWMAGTIYSAHNAIDGRLPDDWIYEAVHSLACNYNTHDDADECRDEESEVCDGLVDVYTSALTTWLASHLGNVALCDEAADEFGLEEHNDIDHRIRMGQLLAYQRISGALLECVEAVAEDRDNADEENSDEESDVA